ncbi:hypothetical protein SCHPADRAFT_76172 [Schizopora paradoxa]|uniref:Uncharacterized protein n=1 Tax=Schizopora paradoxa TaxID=27342 RepID=A0A0H2SQT6_9AGAM|nr:hypothetical protein SCHPADRAFT_76172 [Schizopora paradoxa]
MFIRSVDAQLSNPLNSLPRTAGEHPLSIVARGSSSGGGNSNSGGGNSNSSGGNSNAGGSDSENGGRNERGNEMIGNSSSGPQCPPSQSGVFNISGFSILDDNNATVVYNGSWALVTGQQAVGAFTQHQTFSQNASLFAPFSGSQITVIGTVLNGNETITANYSVDGGPPQTRIVPSNSGCPITIDPFFTMTGLEEGDHNISITVVQVGNRPFMFNFFALEPMASSTSSKEHHAKKLDAGKIAGGVIGGDYATFMRGIVQMTPENNHR